MESDITGGNSRRRRLSSSANTASLKYDGSKFEMSSSVLIKGDLNVTGSILKNVVSFYAKADTYHAITAGDGHHLISSDFDNTVLNIGDAWNNGYFTAPVRGLYQFTLVLQLYSDTCTAGMQFYFAVDDISRKMTWVACSSWVVPAWHGAWPPPLASPNSKLAKLLAF